MSSWAENFTMASNWQIKHELAYWKARAKALEYENGLLHDIIRKNHLGNQREQDTDNEDSEEQNEADDQNEEFDENAHCVEEDEEFTVSEEFIEFIKANAKFKEDARRERELLRQKENTDDITDEPQQTSVLSEDHYKELYGDKWERICALEMSLTADFMDKKDEYKPAYWPNIPFNFS
ncbi:unnamed protein product [Leptosia nina]|uniref:Gem-associated protein 8 n=1 Tax=Leptosia nina TaxID=320188 RepID=A0AAV1IVN4_9NEOP